MSTPRLVRKKDQACLASQLQLAQTPSTRLRGWMGKQVIGSEEALWIEPCNSIHMWWMKVGLDVVFLRADGTVARIFENLKPWKLAPVWCWNAQVAVELPLGAAKKWNIQIGDELCIAS